MRWARAYADWVGRPTHRERGFAEWLHDRPRRRKAGRAASAWGGSWIDVAGGPSERRALAWLLAPVYLGIGLLLLGVTETSDGSFLIAKSPLLWLAAAGLIAASSLTLIHLMFAAFAAVVAAFDAFSDGPWRNWRPLLRPSVPLAVCRFRLLLPFTGPLGFARIARSLRTITHDVEFRSTQQTSPLRRFAWRRLERRLATAQRSLAARAAGRRTRLLARYRLRRFVTAERHLVVFVLQSNDALPIPAENRDSAAVSRLVWEYALDDPDRRWPHWFDRRQTRPHLLVVAPHWFYAALEASGTVLHRHMSDPVVLGDAPLDMVSALFEPYGNGPMSQIDQVVGAASLL